MYDLGNETTKTTVMTASEAGDLEREAVPLAVAQMSVDIVLKPKVEVFPASTTLVKDSLVSHVPVDGRKMASNCIFMRLTIPSG